MAWPLIQGKMRKGPHEGNSKFDNYQVLIFITEQHRVINTNIPNSENPKFKYFKGKEVKPNISIYTPHTPATTNHSPNKASASSTTLTPSSEKPFLQVTKILYNSKGTIIEKEFIIVH